MGSEWIRAPSSTRELKIPRQEQRLLLLAPLTSLTSINKAPVLLIGWFFHLQPAVLKIALWFPATGYCSSAAGTYGNSCTYAFSALVRMLRKLLLINIKGERLIKDLFTIYSFLSGILRYEFLVGLFYSVNYNISLRYVEQTMSWKWMRDCSIFLLQLTLTNLVILCVYHLALDILASRHKNIEPIKNVHAFKGCWWGGGDYSTTCRTAQRRINSCYLLKSSIPFTN